MTGLIPEKGNPAHAVCCKVLNLLSQVGPDPETPPWLRPIALFLKDGEPILRVLAQNRWRNITNTAGSLFLYHKPKWVCRELLITSSLRVHALDRPRKGYGLPDVFDAA